MQQHYKFVVRLLNRQRDVIAWNVMWGMARGDGTLRATQDFLAEAQQTDVATDLCVHWVDVHVHMTSPLPQPIACDVGKVVVVPMRDAPLFTLTGDDRPLPGVTQTQSVSVSVEMARG